MKIHKKEKPDEVCKSAVFFCIMAFIVMMGTILFHLAFGYVW